MGNVHPKQTVGQVVSGWTGIAVEQAGSIQQCVAYLDPQTIVLLKI